MTERYGALPGLASDLRPCERCGSETCRVVSIAAGKWAVNCECGLATIGCDTKAEAVAVWNRRPVEMHKPKWIDPGVHSIYEIEIDVNAAPDAPQSKSARHRMRSWDGEPTFGWMPGWPADRWK